MTDKQDLWYSKMLCKSSSKTFSFINIFYLALIFGVVCILVTYLVSLLGNLLQATLSLFGVLSGPISAIFMIGFFIPWVNSAVGFPEDFFLVKIKNLGCINWINC